MNSLTFPEGDRRGRVASSLPAWSDWAPLALTIGVIGVWILWASSLNTAQFGDNVEQFNWAQSWELGYHKHPPMPSWLLRSLIVAFGPSIYWAYLLSAIALAGTAVFTWLFARGLMGSRVASAGVLLWGLNMAVAQRAQLYNHNTLLIFFIAGATWATWEASRPVRSRRLRWWVAAGLFGSGAMLSKYQALVPLAGIVIALVASQRLRSVNARLGLALSLSVLVLCCLPHALWAWRHDFTTLRYASEAVVDSGIADRLGSIASFVANQFRIWMPAALAMLIYVAWNAWRPTEAESSETSLPTTLVETRCWMFGTLGWGLSMLVVLGLVFAVDLRNHWGTQALQFAGVFLAAGLDRRRRIDLSRLAICVLVLHGINLDWYAFEHQQRLGTSSSRRIDTMYPAQDLADAATTLWRSRTDCPLRYVAGTAFDAGLVSLYSGGISEVFDSVAATPWVRPDALRTQGALHVVASEGPMPEGVGDIVPFEFVDHAGHASGRRVLLGVQLPLVSCAAALAGGRHGRAH